MRIRAPLFVFVVLLILKLANIVNVSWLVVFLVPGILFAGFIISVIIFTVAFLKIEKAMKIYSNGKKL